MKLQVTEVQIVPIKPKDGLVAFASIVVSGQLYLGSIGIHTKLNGGYRLTYPTKLVGGKDMHIFHPITQEASAIIEQAIFSKFKNVMEKRDDRYCSADASNE